jgi:hypothetical protein
MTDRRHDLAHKSPTVRRLNLMRALDGQPPIVTHYTTSQPPKPLRGDAWTFHRALLSGRVRVRCARCGRVEDRRDATAGRRFHGCAT